MFVFLHIFAFKLGAHKTRQTDMEGITHNAAH